MYFKDFEIRWSDVDANRHLANSAYINFMSHTRVSFYGSHGMSITDLAKNDIGPILFYEHIHYFKEAHLGIPVRVSLEIMGFSEDGMYFTIEHNLYNHKGEHLATCEVLGAWMNLKTRSLTGIPEHLIEVMNNFPKSKDFKILTKEDTRKYGKRPVNLVF